MSKEELIEKVRKGYSPDWEAAPESKEVVNDIEKLYSEKISSTEYFELKTKIITYLSINCIEEFERGKREQGFLNKKILERLLFELSEAESEVKQKWK